MAEDYFDIIDSYHKYHKKKKPREIYEEVTEEDLADIDLVARRELDRQIAEDKRKRKGRSGRQ